MSFSSNTVSAPASLLVNSFDKNRASLYSLACRITKSHQQAEDILQNVFLKVWEQRDTLASVNNIDGWLHTVTKNELIDFLRKTAANKRLQDRLWKKLSQNASCVEDEYNAKESAARIQHVVEALPPQRKLVYRLNREGGLNYRQIAEKLSISTHTVKNQISLALRSISQILTFLYVSMFLQ